MVPNEQEVWLLQHQQQQMEQQTQHRNQSLPHSPQHEPILRSEADPEQNAIGFTPIQVAAPNIDPNMQPHQPIPILDPAVISMTPSPMQWYVQLFLCF